MPGIVDQLRAVVGDVVDDPDLYAGALVDWTGRWKGSATALVRPGSVHEVQAAIDVCRRHGVPLVPQGGNTGLVGGSVPVDGGVVLSTARFDAIEDGDLDSGQVTAGAGVTLANLQAAVAGTGWAYAVDLAARDSATVGGMVATNAGGLHVIRHGDTAAQVLGVEAVLGSGDVVRDLHGLVKDNTGYRLAQLLCGSEGTLGVVTRVRLRLVPETTDRVVAIVGVDTMEDAVALAGAARRSTTLEAAEFVLAEGLRLICEHRGWPPPLDPIPPVLVTLEVSSDVDSLASVVGDRPAAVATDPARRVELWRYREAHTEAIAAQGVPHKLDVTLPASELAGFCRDVLDVVPAGATTYLFGHLGDGNVHVNVLGADDVDDAVLALVLERRGSISAEHGIGRHKVGWLTSQRGEQAVAAMRRIKFALDPDGLMNPGVLLPPPGP